MSNTPNIKLLSGNSHPKLAELISDHLAMPLVKCRHDSFSNTERRVIIEENIRNQNVFIVQTGSFDDKYSVNDYLMETFILVDACRRSSANTVTLIMPCFPYARQDKKDKPRSPISSKLVANFLEKAGCDRVMTVDLHAAQITGFFDIPVDNLYASKLLCCHLNKEYLSKNENYQNEFMLVSPDYGGMKRLEAMANRLNLPMVSMHKKRSYEEKNLVEKTTLLGEAGCVEGKCCFIIDDMCDTGGTLVKATEVLTENGASDVKVVVVHGILSGPAIERLVKCEAISEVIVTNTLPQEENQKKLDKLRVVDISHILSKAIHLLCTGGSISALFN